MARKSKPAVRLVETTKGCALYESNNRYDVYLHGEKVDQLYFNTRGYVGTIPYPNLDDDPSRPRNHVFMVSPGEAGLSAYKREVADANRRFKKLAETTGQTVNYVPVPA